jgi:hypothetical protein
MQGKYGLLKIILGKKAEILLQGLMRHSVVYPDHSFLQVLVIMIMVPLKIHKP